MQAYAILFVDFLPEINFLRPLVPLYLVLVQRDDINLHGRSRNQPNHCQRLLPVIARKAEKVDLPV